MITLTTTLAIILTLLSLVLIVLLPIFIGKQFDFSKDFNYTDMWLFGFMVIIAMILTIAFAVCSAWLLYTFFYNVLKH